MLIPLFRILLIITIIILIYTFIQYFRNPCRKLKKSIRQQTYFLLDETDNPKRNLLLTYKGCLFEGEKYVGTTTNAFDIISIYMFVDEPLDLKGITADDLALLEEKLLESYPHAQIEWKHPVNQIIRFSIK